MPGEPKQKYKNEQHERAMSAPISHRANYDTTRTDTTDVDLDKKLREKGLI